MMWKRIICWFIGHIPDLIRISDGGFVKCERCAKPIGTAVPPKPVVTVTAPPGPPKA